MVILKKEQSQKYFRISWCILTIGILWILGATATRSATLPKRVQAALVEYKNASSQKPHSESSPPKTPNSSTNMFSPPPKKEIPKCLAVLGNEALINGKWYKPGDMAEGARIIAVNPKSVKILWQEKEHSLVPFDVQVQYAKQSEGGKSPSGEIASPPSPSPDNRSGRGPGMRDPQNMGRRGPGGLSPEQRQAMYERYQNASPQEQEAMRQQMRERSGGRGRGSRRPGRSRD
ncbi:MAG: hypothetical protein ACYSSM_01500 [Planctomycetota bacterium]|jgi:hypothetical protein